MGNFSVKISNYKCFSDEIGFDDILRVNLIIGRNNSGKSSLLDLIEAVVKKNYKFDPNTWRNNQPPQVIFEASISENDVNRTFPSNTSGGHIGRNHRQYGQQYIGRKIKWCISSSDKFMKAELINCDDNGISPSLENTGEYSQKLVNNMNIIFEGKTFRRLSAERDILPEPANNGIISISNNGNGLTNAIQSYINRSNLPSELIETELLDGLNIIFAHDAVFTDIVCQLHSNNNWEIFLEEKLKGRIALSRSGSGLKTVISVLACLIIVPHIENKPLDQYIFGFEELENNIHPALLRRLNDYIYKLSKEKDFKYFLTTHSNVLIDQYSRQSDAQIIHVHHNGESSTSFTAKTYIENNGILDDLDVRASDLLQANGIIWVEGPSDRIYMNRWIDIWTNGNFKEGTHYQIIFYGGRLLSHLSAEKPEDLDSGVSILNTNRNAIILIDSDKRNEQTKLNETKVRIKDEFDKIGAMCWITQGREIENYIPSTVVDTVFGSNKSNQVGKYDIFFEHLDMLVKGEGKKYSVKKTSLAEMIAPHMDIENMTKILNFEECISRVCDLIQKWNS